jgi:hypothetical protein
MTEHIFARHSITLFMRATATVCTALVGVFVVVSKILIWS